MARRRVSGGPVGTRLPTQRSQFARQAVPQAQSSRAGLEGMGQAFADFFGMAQRSIGNLYDEAMIGEQERIKQENRAEKIQAQNDFYSGKGPDPDLKNDLDYMDTFKGLQAKRVASDASRDFQTWYQEEYLPNNRFGDLAAARDQWAMENLGGIQDPEVSAQVMGNFYRQTEPMLGTHAENAVRFRREEDLINLNSSINEEVRDGTMTPERMAWYINAAQQIDPLNWNEAAPRVVGSLMSAVRNNPEKTEQVISLLTQEGTGINGKSFADSFPDAFADFQSGALTEYLQTNTMAEYEFFRGIEDELRNNPNLSIQDLTGLASQVVAGRALYGAGRQADALQDMIATRLNTMAEDASNIGMVGYMLQNPGALDASHLRKHYMDYMEQVHGTRNVLDVDPGVLANDISRMSGVVPEDIKYQLANALTNTADPEAQEKALRLLSGIQSARGGDYAQNYLTDEASRWFNHVQSHLKTNMPLADALRRTNEARSTERLPENFDWRTVTGEKTLGDAQEVADREIDKQVQAYFDRNGLLTGAFRRNITIPENVMGQIRDYALTVYAERGADNITMEDAVQEAINRHMGQADIVGTESNPVLLLRDPDDQIQEGDEGVEPRVRLGTNVMSPAGVPVNTHQVYLDDLEQLKETAPWVFPNGDDEEVVIDYQEVVPGAFQIRQGGSRIVFEVGETATFDGTNYTVPGNEEELEAMFKDVMPEGFGFVAERGADDEVIGWQLMYKPHFGEYGKDVTDMEEAFALGDARTPEMELNDYAKAMIAAQRESGILPATSGVNKPLPTFRSGEDVMKFMEQELNRGLSQMGRRFIDRHAVSFDDTYRARRMKLLTGKESIRTRVYDDRTGGSLRPGQSAKGYRTVGIGFNMDRSGARETWNKVFGSDGPDFDAVRRGEVAITEAQAQKLFEHDMVYFEGVVADAADGRTLPENQHLALLSIAYNSPKRVKDMGNHIAAGNHAGIIHAMLYESFDPNHPQRQALASRRYAEVRMYAGQDPMLRSMIPSMEDYLNYWR